MVTLPLVSVIIPVYNGSNYLRKAIDSVIGQTYSHIEIIVVNDGSSDDGATKEIALSYKTNIRYFEKKNGGVASALNLGLKEMKGEFFSWLSHDDQYYPNKIEEQVLFAQKKGDNFIVYSDFDIIDSEGVTNWVSILPEICPEDFKAWLTLESRLHGCTLLIPKKSFDDYGGFDTQLLTTQDYDLWFKMAQTYSFVRLPKVLVSSRQHDGQSTKTMTLQVETECNELHHKFFLEFSRSTEHKYNDDFLLNMAKSFYKRQFYLAAFLAFREIERNGRNVKAHLISKFYRLKIFVQLELRKKQLLKSSVK